MVVVGIPALAQWPVPLCRGTHARHDDALSSYSTAENAFSPYDISESMREKEWRSRKRGMQAS